MSGPYFSRSIASKGGYRKDFKNRKTKAQPKGETRTEQETNPTWRA